MKKVFKCLTVLLLVVSLFPVSSFAFSGEVRMGAGSYSTVKPSGVPDVQSQIWKTERVTGAMPTNDWWSNLAWDQFSERQYPHPLAVWPKEAGLQIRYPGPSITGNSSCVCGWIDANSNDDFILGSTAVSQFDSAKVDGFSDWIVSARFEKGANSVRMTYGHGSPYVYAEFFGGQPELTFPSTPTVWAGDAGSSVLGITINNRHYGLFGPSGSTWSGIGTNTLINHLNGNDYFSIAVLPDASVQTLNLFQQYAYAHVTDTKAEYAYNEQTSEVTTTYRFTTEAKEGSQTGTIFALYPHQWRHLAAGNLLDFTYASVRGTMKAAAGTSFETVMTFPGVLPSLPDLGTYDKATLQSYIDEAEAQNYSGATDTYWIGKRLGKLAVLAPIAEQVGDSAAADRFRSEIKSRLEDWLKASDASGHLESSEMFYYNDNWGTLLGYPDSYGSVEEMNDHHFHYGYLIKAAAEIARVDQNWANESNWGAMVNLLIKDIANPDRNDTRFPYLRNFDIYEGHSWASGHARFGDGNNNESSSEGMNAWAGIILWGEATGNEALRDLGIYLYTTEMHAINEYWFDVHGENFHPDFTRSTASMVWGGKVVGDGTWWTGNPEEVHGINWLPFTAASLYLTHYPEYTRENYEALVEENGGTNWDAWEDLIWMYRAIENPQDAIQQYNARAEVFAPEEGNSKANTYHWIHNLHALGTVDPSVTADDPLYAVFKKGSTRTYVVYNMSDSPKTVTFSDGTQVTAEPNSFNIGNGDTGGSDTEAPSVPANLFSPSHTDSTVDLRWDASTDNVGVAGYTVLRNGVEIATTPSTSYQDTGLYANTTYRYTVRAFDAAGNQSDESASVQVTTDADGADTITTEDYTIEIVKISETEALFRFTPNAPSDFVDLHYVADGGVQQNVRAENNGGVWEYTVPGLSTESTVEYFYTYTKDSLGYDSPSYSYTH